MKREPIASVPVPKTWLALLTLSALAANLAPALAETPVLGAQAQERPEASSEGSAWKFGQDDKEWLLDEESGRRYRIEKLPKREGTYQWVDEAKTTVRFPTGAQLLVVEHDDDWFWVKYYEPRWERREPVQKGPTAEELTAAAASYEFEVANVDRLAFAEFDSGLPRRGQWRNGFDIADMNGDGHLDIVFGPARKGRPRPNVFLGDGSGAWRPWSEARYPGLPYDYGDAEAADFNGDGHMDLAFGVHLRGLIVLVSDGEAGFRPWTEGIGFDVPGQGGDASSFSSRALDSVDWNGDGHLDVIALGEGPKQARMERRGTPKGVIDSSRGFMVYLNRGDGTWQRWRPVQDSRSLRPNFGDSFAIGDFNHDEQADLVTSSRQMASKVILRLGKGGGQVTEESLPQVRPRALVTAVALADFNADRHDDVVLGYTNREHGVWRTGIDVVYGSPELDWKRRTLFAEESRRSITSVATGNLDGDGRPDVVALTGEGEIFVYLGDEDGFFAQEPEVLTRREKGCEGFGLRLVDLDGDGRDEVVAGFAGERTGYPGMPGLNFPGCTGQGSVRVWKTSPNS